MRRISEVLKERYGEKIYRLALSSGCTCPNRDGRVGYGGCSFCSQGGSGEFAAPPGDINEQIEQAKNLVRGKTRGERFIAYFQSFTNTYGDLKRLEELYRSVVLRDDIVILSIGTRPDCIDDDVLGMLVRLREIKPVWIELGLQTIHERSAERINRCYTLPVFEEAYKRLKFSGIDVIIHLIMGLPGESREDMLSSIRYISRLDPLPDGVKLQLLQILRGTGMAQDYQRNPFPIMTLPEYAALLEDALSIMPDDIIIHRLTGDGPKSLLIQPEWCADKKRVHNYLRSRLGLS